MAKQPEIVSIRSSAAEYLTFVAASGNGGVEAVYADENVWLSQKMMAQLYDVDVRTINYHLKTVFADSELEAASVIQKFRITAADGKGYDTPEQRHSGQDHAILAARHALYSEAKAANPARWSGHTRNWDPVLVVTLNPERDAIINAHLKGIDRQPLAA